MGPHVNSAVEGEAHSVVHYFCRNHDNTFAQGITWFDPSSNPYTPGSSGVNSRIVADDSQLSIYNLVRGDAGMYRCQRNSNTSEFDEACLLVDGDNV